jgi:hypothetical protein
MIKKNNVCNLPDPVSGKWYIITDKNSNKDQCSQNT